MLFRLNKLNRFVLIVPKNRIPAISEQRLCFVINIAITWWVMWCGCAQQNVFLVKVNLLSCQNIYFKLIHLIYDQIIDKLWSGNNQLTVQWTSELQRYVWTGHLRQPRISLVWTMSSWLRDLLCVCSWALFLHLVCQWDCSKNKIE